MDAKFVTRKTAVPGHRARAALPLLVAVVVGSGCSSSSGGTAPGHQSDTPGAPSAGGGPSAPGAGGSPSAGAPSAMLPGGSPTMPPSGGAPPTTFPPGGGAPGFGGTPPSTIGGTGGGVPPTGGAPSGGAPPAGGANGGGATGNVEPSKGCEGETMPPVTGDYSANGPMPSTVVNNTGPDGMYTIYRPTTLGANGFKHPIATWGNGITTTPAYYPGLLGAIASHGFVIIASNSTNVTADLMTQGLDWMIQQNDASGDYQGKLNPTCLVTIGYSLGGGASVGAGAHANVVATASMHGVTGPSNALHGPLLLLTAETDTFVVPATFVTPTFNLSSVQTFYGTLGMAADPGNSGHLIPVDLLPSNANTLERAAMIAWLRLWVYNDQGAKHYFYGDDCVLCKDPWVMPQRKNWN